MRVTIFDGQVIDLDSLSTDELKLLHYNEEIKFVAAIKKSIPFSNERKLLLKNGYDMVSKIVASINKEIRSYGAGDIHINLVNSCIKDIKKNRAKSIIFFEIGVGIGLVFKNVQKIEGVTAKGCDVNKMCDDSNVLEMDVIEGLNQLDDESVDIFYWNDVLEHLLEDEVDFIISLIKKKLSSGGMLITVTPNRLTGPWDISRLFEPLGTKAKGFHFHEYTFAEVLNLMKIHGLKSYKSVIRPIKLRKFQNYIILPLNINIIKKIIEKLSLLFPYKMRKKVLTFIGSEVSIMKKI